MHSQLTKTQRLPQFDNEGVKVWKSVMLTNAPVTMHRHNHPRMIIALTGGTMKIVDPNGASEEHVWETGKAYRLPANPPDTMQADVNAWRQTDRSDGCGAREGAVEPLVAAGVWWKHS